MSSDKQMFRSMVQQHYVLIDFVMDMCIGFSSGKEGT